MKIIVECFANTRNWRSPERDGAHRVGVFEADFVPAVGSLVTVGPDELTERVSEVYFDIFRNEVTVMVPWVDPGEKDETP